MRENLDGRLELEDGELLMGSPCRVANDTLLSPLLVHFVCIKLYHNHRHGVKAFFRSITEAVIEFNHDSFPVQPWIANALKEFWLMSRIGAKNGESLLF